MTNHRTQEGSTKMLELVDHGVRCDRHVGEVYPPRCAACEILARPRPRCGYQPGTECGLHAGYPEPCARCDRDLEEAGLG